jgi:NADPH:quinone reductase-like Zn-dependent oxidoreductase
VLVGGEDGGDLTGGMNRSLRALALSLLVGQRFAWFIAKQRAGDLARLSELIEAGTVTPSIDRTYPLDEVPTAMRRLGAGQVRGKVAITLDARP